MTTSEAAPWEILLAAPARKSLDRISSPDRERIESDLKEMVTNPFQGDVKLLKGKQRRFRRRVGNWRIFFSRIPDRRTLIISAIERRTSTTY
jgi:mRNA-degrading endonuclease RelE of RelBE toxin-antitoxin system